MFTNFTKNKPTNYPQNKKKEQTTNVQKRSQQLMKHQLDEETPTTVQNVEEKNNECSKT